MTWSELKRELLKKDPKQLLETIKSLYDLNKGNKTFLQALLRAGDPEAIKFYKGVISESVNPNGEKPIKLSQGKKAISDYRKAAPDDVFGQVDLMLHYVESGTRFTLAYGDIDGPFYDSLCSMIDNILKAALNLSFSDHATVVSRMSAIDKKIRGQIGWGYSDYVEDATIELSQQVPGKE